MFPGMGKVDPRKLQGMMKQLGIDQQGVDAESVIINKRDGSRIIIENPSVQRISMQGQHSYQISGNEREENEGIRPDDIKLVAEKSGKSESEARAALEASEGDIASAIMSLSEE